MAPFTPQDFYGGTIQGIIPQGWLDASDLREVPDHQEIFLSPSTLSNQIIEINQLVESTTAPAPPNDPTPEATDKAAALYHLQDLCDETDKLEILSGPEKVTMAGIPSARAYRGKVALTSLKKQRGGNEGVPTPASVGGAAAGSSAEGALSSTVSCYYLLVRLEAQETDLLVFFNVPREEFEAKGDLSGLGVEEGVASDAVGELVQRLRIVDWGLFA